MNILLKTITQHLELLFKFNIRYLFQLNNLAEHHLSYNQEKVYFLLIVNHSLLSILKLKKFSIKIIIVLV